MNIQVKGTTELKFTVDAKDCINAIYESLGFNDDYFISNGKLYECIDIGHHKSEYKNVLISEDIYVVRLFEACQTLYSHLIIK